MSDYTFSKLVIADLRLWVHLGCGEEEKLHPQMVSFDIEVLFKNPPKAIANDCLEDTICYAKLVQEVKAVCAGGRFNLVERLTGDVHASIKNYIANQKCLVESINVTVCKISPPVPDVHGGVFFTYQS
ncbi:MAG: dihydroneopterin aldolase [Candidatus Midichloriaceae bacterium]|jgi:dihydroneopterin aldolase|nr:dihydroneopterin aldolase [Candidatus Midichloriaceae bacterium]